MIVNKRGCTGRRRKCPKGTSTFSYLLSAICVSIRRSVYLGRAFTLCKLQAANAHWVEISYSTMLEGDVTIDLGGRLRFSPKTVVLTPRRTVS